MTTKQLEAEGFKKYTHNERELYQKKITDEFGTKYFIDISYFAYDDNGFFSPSMQCKTQYDTVQVELVQWFNTLNGVQHSDNTLEDMYKYIEEFWEFSGEYYYEKYYE